MFSFLILLWEVFQVVIAVVASIVFLVFAGLTLAGSALALSVTTPLFIIFSPILVPATIATAVLTTGFTAGSTLGATAIALIRRSGRMGVKPKKNLPPPTAEGSSSAASAQTLIEMPITGGYGGSWGGKSFSGTFGNGKSAGGTGPAGGFGGSWGGKPFSWTFPGWFGGIPAAAGGSTPAAAPPSVGGSTPPARKT